MALLLHRARFQVQYTSRVLRLLRRQLLAHLVLVVRMQAVVEAGPVPLILRVV